MKKPKYVDIGGRIYMKAPKEFKLRDRHGELDIAVVLPFKFLNESRETIHNNIARNYAIVSDMVGGGHMGKVSCVVFSLITNAEKILYSVNECGGNKATRILNTRVQENAADESVQGILSYTQFIVTTAMSYPDTATGKKFVQLQIDKFITNVLTELPIPVMDMASNYLKDLVKFRDILCDDDMPCENEHTTNESANVNARNDDSASDSDDESFNPIEQAFSLLPETARLITELESLSIDDPEGAITNVSITYPANIHPCIRMCTEIALDMAHHLDSLMHSRMKDLHDSKTYRMVCAILGYSHVPAYIMRITANTCESVMNNVVSTGSVDYKFLYNLRNISNRLLPGRGGKFTRATQDYITAMEMFYVVVVNYPCS